jgi:hypothetical protein
MACGIDTVLGMNGIVGINLESVRMNSSLTGGTAEAKKKKKMTA